MQAYLEFIRELACSTGPVKNANVPEAEHVTGLQFPQFGSPLEQERFWAYYRATVRLLEAEALANLLLGRGYVLTPKNEPEDEEPDVDNYAGG